jgi:hypothetical protein
LIDAIERGAKAKYEWIGSTDCLNGMTPLDIYNRGFDDGLRRALDEARKFG